MENLQKLIWHTEKRQVKVLIPTEGNPRQMTKDQAADLEKSLKKFNLVDIPAINTDNRIISGHQRITLLKALGRGDEKIDVRVPNRQLTEEEHREYMLRANKNQGEWDIDLLANIDEELLKEVGWDSEELDQLFQLDTDDEKADKVPEIRKTDIKLGDMFKLGNHKLLCGDATKKEDVDKLMAGEKADMVFTDPPYGIEMSRSESIKNDNLEGLEKLLESVFNNILLVTKQNIHLYCWIGFRGYSIAEKVISNNWKISNCIVWKKPYFGLGSKGYRLQHELCIFSGQIENRSESDVWEFDKDLKPKHPTVKPVGLCEKGIINSSKRDDIIIDLFGGSGSTLIACEKTNRQCRMMELDETYCQVIIDRWEQFSNKKAEKI